ncbi:MAG: Uma2 family endonuclease [Planctomycetaceae bacterium]|nr:Uma2 family endonuclease [Planctomycetaceae bacterium]
MIDEALMTAEDYARIKYDLPEGGRWTELFAGRVVSLQPPDEMHGNIVLNLSKAMAATYQSNPQPLGMACFDVSILVRRNPDSLLSPAMSYFSNEMGFAPVDEIYTERKPRLVCEIASTNDRRKNIAERVLAYLGCGIEVVWVVDPFDKCCHVYQVDQRPYQLSEQETLDGGSVVADFRIPVANLFAEPSWWK